jgi:hypothetical protein
VRISAPYAATVEILRAQADVTVRGFKSAVVVRACEGDLLLRHCDSADLGTVHGSLRVHDLAGDLKARTVGGDAKLRHILGAVELEAGGDVRIENPVSRAQIRTGGDASIAILPKPGTENRIVAHGDLRCYLPAGASAVVEAKAGGDVFVRLPSPGKESQTPTESAVFPLTLGKGDARLTLEADGDLWIGGWMDVDSWGEWRELGRDMGQLGMEFGMLAGEFGRWAERNMREKFTDYERQLRRKMDESRFARGRRSSGWDARPSQPPSPSGAGESERLSILERLQQGKITVDEAERLLAALEKNG